MTSSSRILIALSIILLPTSTAAYVIDSDYEYPQIHRPAAADASSVSSESSISSVPSITPEQQQWIDRAERTQGFWAEMMNSRTAQTALRNQRVIGREKRKDKRLACRADIRKANRDAILRETLTCYKATLSQELEILRKERQFAKDMFGVTFEFRGGADFHIGNLMQAITSLIARIDSGAYTSKESLTEAKQNLEKTYGAQKRLAMTRARIDRSVTWLNHLMVRLITISEDTAPSEPVQAKIDEAMACFRDQEMLLKELLPMEDNDTLIKKFRQVQSDTKFCIELARAAHALNTEIEQ